MLKRVIAFSLKQSPLVLFIAGLLTLYAGLSLNKMPIDVFPELNAPTVVVMTEAGGLSADEVENYVTVPVESVVNGLPGVRRVRSSSAISLSIVWVEFDFGEDIYKARQLVSERLDSAREVLPEQVHTEIAPISSIAGEIMLISLSGDSSKGEPASPLELRSFAEFELRNRLLAVPGIAQVVAIGGELPEYQVNVKQDKLRDYGLTIQDVIEATEGAHSTDSAGYFVNVQGLELPIRQDARVKSVQDIADTIIRAKDGSSIRLGEVAEIALQGAPKRGTGAEGGESAVVISIQKAPGTNTLGLTDKLDAVFEQTQNALPPGMKLNVHVMRQSDFIGVSIDNLVHVLRDAAIFVAIVLILFLMNVRTTIITLTAIPLSLGLSLLLLWFWGLTINVMTLGGLAVAIGELVDDAIIDVENVFRRLRENAGLPEHQQREKLRVIFDASNEIRSSIVFATIIITLVFVPLLFLSGLEGRFFRPLGIAYITSILCSLVVALTVTPAMCRYLLNSKRFKQEREGFLVRGMKWVYRPMLKFCIKLRYVVLVLAFATSGCALWLGSTFGTSFLPEFNEGTFTVFLMAPPGTSLPESDRLARGVEKEIAKIEGVRAVVRRTGRAERDEHAEPVSSSEIEVSVKQGFAKADVRAEIDQVLGKIPGITTMVGQPIEHRLSHILSGTPAAIAINVYGDDLDVLRTIAKEIEVELKQVPGARDVAANREVMITSLPVEYRHDKLAEWGLTPAEAAHQLSAAFYGHKVASVNQGIKLYDLVVRLAPEERKRIDDLKGFLLTTPSGAQVRLDEIARVGIERSSNLIARENGRRKAVISCNVAEGYNLGHLVAAVQEKVNPIVAKHRYTVHYGGQFEAQQSASKTILMMGAGVGVLILLLLNLALGSLRGSLLVMVNLPLAIIGGIAAIFIAESPNVITNASALLGFSNDMYVAPVISIASLVGFVTLFGIAVRNGILLVNHYHYLMEEDGLSLRESVTLGSEERLVPILMTALTAVLGLVPLAMAAGEPGSELLAPLAVVVLGGLITSTFLNLVVVPAGYIAFGKQRKRHDGDDFDQPEQGSLEQPPLLAPEISNAD